MSQKQKVDALLERLKDKNQADYDHSLRVRELVKKILTKYKLKKAEKDPTLDAAVLHDIGKLDISDEILNKKGRLTWEEYKAIQEHVEAGYTTLSDLEGQEEITKLIRHHHESFDGFGYPDGLKGEAIPFGSRVIHIAEAYDSMIGGRSLQPFTKKDALKEMESLSGKLYDPEILKKFKAALTPATKKKKT